MTTRIDVIALAGDQIATLISTLVSRGTAARTES
jgi:hypothetical protein